MLGDCYASAVVEELSKKELMALDMAGQQTATASPQLLANGHTDIDHPKCIAYNADNSIV